MPDLIPLSKLNELRHKSCPKSMRSLRHHAALGKIPGCMWIYGGWHVDLEVYDKALQELMDADAPNPASTPDQLDKVALGIMQKLEFKKAS